MNLQEIHDMTADALADEELQFRNNGDWHDYTPNCVQAFDCDYHWRIKPTIEINGVMMSKRQAKAAWEASGATSYEFSTGTEWVLRAERAPTWNNTEYRWQEPQWIYVNGEKITQSGGKVIFAVFRVANDTEGEKLQAAIYKLIEIK